MKNENGFVHESALLKDSDVGKAKIFRDAVVVNTKMGNGCSIGDDTTIERCCFENNVVINRRSYINDSFIGRYTYTGINTTINYSRIGAFCSLARNVDIGGFDHDYHKVTTLPLFRINQMQNGGGKLNFINEHECYCEIGNDVWIAAGAQILHKAKISDGAVIGAGAVVTHDVPAYAIVAGVPAKVIGYRCSEACITRLLKIKWWNWPECVIHENLDKLAKSDITEETLIWMEGISKKLDKEGIGMDK